MTKLLISEYPLIVLPSLAKAIGLHEAIILQQIHYWLCKDHAQEREGPRWVYNSYTSWQKQFPFLSLGQIIRTIRHLEALGFVISGNFNALAIDHTKWYRIDYQALEALEIDGLEQPSYTSAQPSDASEQSSSYVTGSKSDVSSSKPITTHSRPLPETTTEITPETPDREIEYLQTLRAIPGWSTKGEPHLETLMAWVTKKAYSDDLLERAAIGLSKAKSKTLLGYTNLASAFQDRLNKGYDDPSRVRETRNDNGAHRRYSQAEEPVYPEGYERPWFTDGIDVG